MAGSTTDGRVLRGEETRRAVLRRAVEIASVEGLDALSIGRLATDLGLSKSGVFAGFGSKEELQLATVRAARRIFADAVVAPVADTPPGLARARALCESWLAYSRARVFPGGCFFFEVNAEFDARPGAVRDALAACAREWHGLVQDALAEARAAGSLRPDTDPADLAFTLIAVLELANSQAVLYDEATPYDRAGRTLLRLLRAEAADPSDPALG
ncbi:TetR/AcrR family transcriptional regulator [Kitasatospora aureofaciens]|uniref:TetR/AcrR family transcriptional regulator n=1 Tax=Kitasatospora aureofaciens TaxID=1894 RepID=UPI001C47BD17|nr:TetR/AcrR family transcriptional regulator [Kitasatospora aureofaciens]MBV6700623.1 TetR/AcrR family transcriptional regulator [Kitasatospora aureofaciens]